MLEDSSLADLLRSPLWEIVALLVGLIVGSFANVCIHRLPRRQSVVTPRSRCPGCGAEIGAWQNIPILSFLALGGRCGKCRAPISWRYPAVEAANGLAYLALAVGYGPSLRTAATAAFVTALLILSLIDLEHHLLPNVITLPGIAFGVGVSLLPGSPIGPVQSLAAAVGGYLALMAVATAYRATRGVEGLGQGDWKMVAMLGAFFGWQRMLLAVFGAALVGSLVGIVLVVARGRDGQYLLPLGTFLGFSGIAIVFFGDPALAWYGSFFDG